jgi:hypothetical protein
MEVDGEENGMPRALDEGDDAEGKVEARRVAFERRREKASKIKVRKGQKPPKDRDWILKKKEVRPPIEHWPNEMIDVLTAAVALPAAGKGECTS